MIDGGLCFIVGSPGSGKTSVLIELGFKASAAGRNVSFFSIDQTARSLEQRHGSLPMTVYDGPEGSDAILQAVQDSKPGDLVMIDMMGLVDAGDGFASVNRFAQRLDRLAKKCHVEIVATIQKREPIGVTGGKHWTMRYPTTELLDK